MGIGTSLCMTGVAGEPEDCSHKQSLCVVRKENDP